MLKIFFYIKLQQQQMYSTPLIIIEILNKYLNQQTNQQHKLFQQRLLTTKMTSYHQQMLITPVTQCQCTCGTRISLDQQLINQRQQWKSKYYCLQKQTTKDIGLLKEKIYQECSTLMHSEFLSKEKGHNAVVNAKSQDIQELTARVIKLETAVKIAEKEKEVLGRRIEEEEKRYTEKVEELAEVKNNHVKKYASLQQQNLTQTGTLKVRITEDYQAKLQKLQKQNEHLSHKISQFQKKYAALIPQVQRLKSIITKKSSQVQGLELQRQKTKQSHNKQVTSLKQKVQQLQSLHYPCGNQISQLIHTISQLQTQLAKAKLVKKQVKVQPVYVDRPVEVERVVEKLIQVERIVKEYIEPEVEYKELEEENRKLKVELEGIVQEMKQFEVRYEAMVVANEAMVRQLEENIAKYKTQRQGLVKRIHEQDQQLQKIYNMINNQPQGYRGQEEPQRIVVMVNKDGTVSKRIEKVTGEERVKATVGKLNGSGRGDVEGGKQTEVQGRNLVGGNRARVVTTTQQMSKKK